MLRHDTRQKVGPATLFPQSAATYNPQHVSGGCYIRPDRLDEAVWREVERLLHDPARIATEYERRLDEARRRGTDGPDLAAAEAQLAKLRRGMGRLIDSYAEGLIERAEFEPRIAGFRQRIAGWDGQIKAIRDEAALQSTLSLVIGRLEDFAKRVHDRMSDVDWSMQRELIRTLVKRVEINQDDINVVFRIDATLPTPDPAHPDQNSFLPDRGRGGDASLWRAAVGGAVLPPPFPAFWPSCIGQLLHHARPQLRLDRRDEHFIIDPPAQQVQQHVVVDVVERGRQLIPLSRTRRLGM